MGRRTGSRISLILMVFWLQVSARTGCEGLGQETCVEEEKLGELHGPDCDVLVSNGKEGSCPAIVTYGDTYRRLFGIHDSTAFIYYGGERTRSGGA